MSPSFLFDKSRNEQHLCTARGCMTRRSGVNQWCAEHVPAARRYGHPSARPLKPALWATERSTVRALLDANADHPGQQSVLSLLTLWMGQAAQSESAFKGAEEVARLARHGVKPSDVLVELCACTCYLHANPRAVPDDRAWDFAISRAIFALAPRPRRYTRAPGSPWPVNGKARTPQQSYAPQPRSSALSSVGKHLRVTLSDFIANVQRSIETREEDQEALRKAMQAPLRVPLNPHKTHRIS